MSSLHKPMRPIRRQQRGVTLLENLVAMLLFSIGVLALIAMVATSVATAGDAQYRIEAVQRAESIIQQIAANVARDAQGAAVGTDLARFVHQANGTAPACAFSGTASSDLIVQDWENWITTGTTKLPGATTATQQILVDTANSNEVHVTICWQAPSDSGFHWHEVVTHVN